MNEKLNELVNDLYTLGFKDGYSSTRADYCYDEIVAEDCLYEYKELGEKYGINFEEYILDSEDYWDTQQGLAWEIEKKIKKQINEIVEK